MQYSNPERQLLTLGRANLPYASDAPVREDLAILGYADLRQFTIEDGTPRSKRSKVRYLAALFPDLDANSLADVIHGVLGNPELSIGDIRLIIDGRRLNDASKRTSEVDVARIQKVGELLASGATHLAAARGSGVSVDTVENIDDYLGLSERYEERLMDLSVAAVRDGWSVRKLAGHSGMSRSRAHRYLTRARRVLVEIGEVSA